MTGGFLLPVGSRLSWLLCLHGCMFVDECHSDAAFAARAINDKILVAEL